jgi:hypothetical protein
MPESTCVDGSETSEVKKLVSTIETQVRRDFAPSHLKRDVHTKMHGCVQAELHVDPDVPEEFRHGVFSHLGHTYRAWVRFSNGFGIQHDLERDTRGMAIKLLGVSGERLPEAEGDTQDFLLATHDAFFMPNLDEYAALVAVTHRAPPVIALFFIWRPRLWRGFKALNKSFGVLAANPLAIPYFSQTAYKLGPRVVKLHARPQLTTALTDSLPPKRAFWRKMFTANWIFGLSLLPHGKAKAKAEMWCLHLATRDLLREAMMSFLDEHGASFELLVQKQGDPRVMPIDDATVRWKQQQAPFRRVATITIPRQVFWPAPNMPETVRVATTRMAELGENMSFNPWHALVDHEPLGAINRARRVIYTAISNLRRDANGVIRDPPTTATYDELRAVVQNRASHPDAGTASPANGRGWRGQATY